MRKARARQGDPDDGDWMLKKADAISGFLAQQRNRTHKAAAKSAWDAAFKQLVTEGNILNKQLLQLLQQAGISNPDAAADMQEVLHLHQHLAAEAQTERLQIMAQVQDLSGLVHSMRCYGLSAVEQLDDTVASLQQEIKWLAQDLQASIAAFAAEAEQLTQEIAADSKAALTGTDLCHGGSFSSRCSAEGYSFAAADVCDADASSGARMEISCEQSSTAGSTSASAAAQDDQLHQLLSKHPLAPGRLKQQVQEAYCALYQQHQQQVQQLAASASGPPGAEQTSGTLGAYGGWSHDDHTLFVRLRGLAYKSASSSHSRGGRSGGRGCSRAAVVEKLSLMMPGKSKKDLEAHDAWYTAANLHQRRMTDLAAAWQRQRSSFLADSDQMLSEASMAATAAAETAAAKLAWEAAGQALHSQLEGLQLVKEQQQQELATQQEAEAAEAAAEAAARQAGWLEQHAAKKAEVAIYRQQQQEQQSAAQQLAEQAEAEARAAAAAAVEAQRPAVAARQAMSWDRMQQQIEQQKQRQVDLEARQQRLAALAETFAPHVTRDPQRLLQPTAASAAAVEAGVEGVGIAAGAAFRPVHGFTTAQVVADPRFRVVEALRQAGLTGGAAKGYVQQVFSGMQPANAIRRGNLTTGQLQAMQGREASH